MKNHAFSLEGKTIFVTGASSGIGQACAMAFALAGAQLVLTGRDSDKLKKVCAELPGQGHKQFAVDLTLPDSAQKIVDFVPSIDGAVFAAGVSEVVPFRMISSAHAQRIFQTNFFSPMLLTQGLLKNKKINPSASLVYISAAASHNSPVGSAMYAASKAALESAVRALALEVAKTKIRANCICPGYVDTPMLDEMKKTTNITEFESNVPLGKISAQDVAYSAIYLLSSAACWVTRSDILIDAGVSIPIR